jgi:hypothetical protein
VQSTTKEQWMSKIRAVLVTARWPTAPELGAGSQRSWQSLRRHHGGACTLDDGCQNGATSTKLERLPSRSGTPKMVSVTGF